MVLAGVMESERVFRPHTLVTRDRHHHDTHPIPPLHTHHPTRALHTHLVHTAHRIMVD